MKAHPFYSHVEVPPDGPRVPYRRIQADVWGPIDVGDPNGFRYLGGWIDEDSGVAYTQPMRTKREFASVIQGFARIFRAQRLRIAQFLGLNVEDVFLGRLAMDKGGENTTTFGATQSQFDSIARSLFNSVFYTSTGMPQTGTAKMERHWDTLYRATKAAMANAPHIPTSFTFYAPSFCSQQYHLLPTEANRMDPSAPPFASLGIRAELSARAPSLRSTLLRAA